MSPLAATKPVPVPPAEELERVYREYAPLVYRTAWGVLGAREDAEDVLQTIFMRLLRRDSQPDLRLNPKAYFYKAALAASLDVLKARRRRPVLVADLDRLEIATPAHGGTFDEALYQRLYDAISQLSADAAAVVLLRYMQNKSVTEIAQELGLSRTAVGVRLFRSRAKLRSLLRVPSENLS